MKGFLFTFIEIGVLFVFIRIPVDHNSVHLIYNLFMGKFKVFNALILAAVSYTHLDVYKRQLLSYSKNAK